MDDATEERSRAAFEEWMKARDPDAIITSFPRLRQWPTEYAEEKVSFGWETWYVAVEWAMQTLPLDKRPKACKA